MNIQYRTIWSTSSQSLQAVADIAKSHGNGHSVCKGADGSHGRVTTSPLRLKTLVLAMAYAWLYTAPPAWASPQGGVVTAGSASISANGTTTTTISQTSSKAAIDWSSFPVGKSESVRLNQYGSYQDTIAVAEGGRIVLVAALVSDSGTLRAPRGSVLLDAGIQVTLTLQDGRSLSCTLGQGSPQATVDNSGLIQTASGHVVLTTKGRDALTRATVNHSHIIEAQTVQEIGGVVELLAGRQGGLVTVSGSIDASAPNAGNGGHVETSAASVKAANGAVVDTRSRLGRTGSWLIEPADHTIQIEGNGIRMAGSNDQLSAL